MVFQSREKLESENTVRFNRASLEPIDVSDVHIRNRVLEILANHLTWRYLGSKAAEGEVSQSRSVSSQPFSQFFELPLVREESARSVAALE